MAGMVWGAALCGDGTWADLLTFHLPLQSSPTSPVAQIDGPFHYRNTSKKDCKLCVSAACRSVQVNDENVGRSVSEVLRLVKAFQYADSHGEGCPGEQLPAYRGGINGATATAAATTQGQAAAVAAAAAGFTATWST